MKDRSKKMCGHGVSVNQRSEVCYLHIVCDFLLYGYPCSKKVYIALQYPESYGIKPTNDRYTSLCIMHVCNELHSLKMYQRKCTFCVSFCTEYVSSPWITLTEH